MELLTIRESRTLLQCKLDEECEREPVYVVEENQPDTTLHRELCDEPRGFVVDLGSTWMKP